MENLTTTKQIIKELKINNDLFYLRSITFMMILSTLKILVNIL